MASVNTTTFLSRLIGQLGGLVADNTALFGIPGELANISANVNQSIISVSTGTGTAATVPATAFPAGCWDLAAGASGGFTLTLPTTAAIIAAFPNTIPADGQFVMELDILNDAVGQTATLTAGDASTTILGTATIATNTNRTYAIQINVNKKTINFMNKGTKAL
jgi:hypothetical protein